MRPFLPSCLNVGSNRRILRECERYWLVACLTPELDIRISPWAQEDVETLYSLLNKYIVLFKIFDSTLTNTLHYQIIYKPKTTLNATADELDTAFHWFPLQVVLNLQAGS